MFIDWEALFCVKLGTVWSCFPNADSFTRICKSYISAQCSNSPTQLVRVKEIVSSKLSQKNNLSIDGITNKNATHTLKNSAADVISVMVNLLLCIMYFRWHLSSKLCNETPKRRFRDCVSRMIMFRNFDHVWNTYTGWLVVECLG